MKLLQNLIFLLTTLIGGMAIASPVSLELDYRIQPDQDQTVETVYEIATLGALYKSRGTVDQPYGNSSTQLSNLHVTTRQSVRIISGKRDPEGRFPVQLIFVDKSTHTKGKDGIERKVQDRLPLMGARVNALVDSSGKVREESVDTSEVEPHLAETLRTMLIAMVTRASEIEPIQLSLGQVISQETMIGLPLPGALALDMKVRTFNTLQSIEDGKALVHYTQVMEYGTPSGSSRIRAEGSGGGTKVYELDTKTLVNSQSASIIKISLDTSEGVIDVQTSLKHSQKIAPTDRAKR